MSVGLPYVLEMTEAEARELTHMLGMMPAGVCGAAFLALYDSLYDGTKPNAGDLNRARALAIAGGKALEIRGPF